MAYKVGRFVRSCGYILSTAQVDNFFLPCVSAKCFFRKAINKVLKKWKLFGL